MTFILLPIEHPALFSQKNKHSIARGSKKIAPISQNFSHCHRVLRKKSQEFANSDRLEIPRARTPGVRLTVARTPISRTPRTRTLFGTVQFYAFFYPLKAAIG